MLWGIILFLLIIPGLVIGWVRGKTIGSTYNAILAELREAAIELSPADHKLLISQLNRDPRKALSGGASSAAKSIIQPHVDALLARTKPLQRYFWIMVVVGVTAILSFLIFWPLPNQ